MPTFELFTDKQRLAEYGRRGGLKRNASARYVWIEGKPVDLHDIAKAAGLSHELVRKRYTAAIRCGRAVKVANLSKPARKTRA